MYTQSWINITRQKLIILNITNFAEETVDKQYLASNHWYMNNRYMKEQ